MANKILPWAISILLGTTAFYYYVESKLNQADAKGYEWYSNKLEKEYFILKGNNMLFVDSLIEEPNIIYETGSKLFLNIPADRKIYKMWYRCPFSSSKLYYSESLDGKIWQQKH